MKLRLYVDEDAQDADLLSALSARGLDVVGASDAGMSGNTDEDQLIWAGSAGRCLFSFNIRHFFALHKQWIEAGRHHAGIVLAQQQRYGTGELMRRLLHLSVRREAEEMRDQIEFLNAWG